MLYIYNVFFSLYYLSKLVTNYSIFVSLPDSSFSYIFIFKFSLTGKIMRFTMLFFSSSNQRLWCRIVNLETTCWISPLKLKCQFQLPKCLFIKCTIFSVLHLNQVKCLNLRISWQLSSSLHNILCNSFQLVLVLWRLLHQGFLFFPYVIVVQKSFCGDWKFTLCG